VPTEIVKRQVALFYRPDPDYGVGVATRMGLAASDLPTARAAE
jgi:catalase